MGAPPRDTVHVVVTGAAPAGLYGTRGDLDAERAAYAPLVGRIRQALETLLHGHDAIEVTTTTEPGACQLAFWAANAMRRDAKPGRVTLRLVTRPATGLPDHGLFGGPMASTMGRIADEVCDPAGAEAAAPARCDVLLAVCDPTECFAATTAGDAIRSAGSAGRRVMLVSP